MEDAHTRGADIGRNAREEMTQTRASASPSQMKLFTTNSHGNNKHDEATLAEILKNG